MQPLPILGALIVCLGTGVLSGQEPPLPKAGSQDPQPTPAASEAVSVPAEPQLIPRTLLGAEGTPSAPPNPNSPTIPQLDEAFKRTPLSAAAENSRLHLEWRTLRNRVAADPRVAKALAAADAARTDLEKRRLLRQYYELYYGRLIELASTPELKNYLNDRKNERLGTLPQPRVRPLPTPTPPPTP